MMTATYFGEISELGSRAVWYSDEEDDDDSIDGDILTTTRQSKLQVEKLSHESMRSNVSVTFKRLQPIDPSLNIVDCIFSLSSSAAHRNFKINDPSSQLKFLGYLGNSGRVFIGLHTLMTGCATSQNDCSLYITFDSNDRCICDHEVAYFVEALRERMYSELNLGHSAPVIILSRQFSQCENLEYLSNCETFGPMLKSPFTSGNRIAPPALIKNHFESALFEQLTLTLKPAFVVCLPDPKNYWFDKTKSWPTVSDEIIEQKLCDDNLEKTLIFT